MFNVKGLLELIKDSRRGIDYHDKVIKERRAYIRDSTAKADRRQAALSEHNKDQADQMPSTVIDPIYNDNIDDGIIYDFNTGRAPAFVRRDNRIRRNDGGMF